mmetsp:Transcript_18267/g.36902  ORF Transcript_18267/g.36902 Transcript_18267/m.36902 type:complete len:314 (-) Transcript_18267:1031-1972(-)
MNARQPRLHAMSEGVSVLKEQSPILFEGVLVREEHGLRLDNLGIDDGEEVGDRSSRCHRQRVVSAADCFDLPTLFSSRRLERHTEALHGRGGSSRCDGREQLGASPSNGSTRFKCCPLRVARLRIADELHETFEAANLREDGGGIARELMCAEDVLIVSLSWCGGRDADHVHRLRRLADGGVDRRTIASAERLIDAEDEPRQVERPQKILRKDLAVDDERESLLGACRRVVEVERRGGNLDEVRVGHRCDNAGRVTVASTADGDDDDRLARALRRRNLLEQYWWRILRVALVHLARAVSEVEPFAAVLREGLE